MTTFAYEILIATHIIGYGEKYSEREILSHHTRMEKNNLSASAYTRTLITIVIRVRSASDGERQLFLDFGGKSEKKGGRPDNSLS